MTWGSQCDNHIWHYQNDRGNIICLCGPIPQHFVEGTGFVNEGEGASKPETQIDYEKTLDQWSYDKSVVGRLSVIEDEIQSLVIAFNKINDTLERLANNLQMVDHFAQPKEDATTYYYMVDPLTGKKHYKGGFFYDSVVRASNIEKFNTPSGWVGEGDSIVPDGYQDMPDPAEEYVDDDAYQISENGVLRSLTREEWEAVSAGDAERASKEKFDEAAEKWYPVDPEWAPSIADKLARRLTDKTDWWLGSPVDPVTKASSGTNIDPEYKTKAQQDEAYWDDGTNMTVREYNIGDKPTYRDLPLDERVPETLPYVIDKNGQIVPEHTLDPNDNPKNKNWPGWSS